MIDHRSPVGIVGLGVSLPDKVLTNADLERLVDTSDEWITTRTGIKERRIADAETYTSHLATEATKRAIADAGLEPGAVNGVIVATVTPDMSFPSTACLVQAAAGLGKGPAFDIAAGCSGFIYALGVAQGLILAGAAENIVVVGAEVLSKIVDWTDRSTCVLFGDGAGAVVVSKTEAEGILSVYLGADGSGGAALSMPAVATLYGMSPESLARQRPYLHMTGNEVYKFAVRVLGSASLKALEMAGVDKADVDLFVPHQANTRIICAAAERLGLSDDKVFVNADRYGNTSAASIPIALYEAHAGGRLKADDLAVIVGFGAGLTWGASVLRWVR